MFDSFFGRPAAYAKITGEAAGSSISGIMYIYPERDGSLLSVRVNGLPRAEGNCGSRFFALHIHEGSACSGEGFPEQVRISARAIASIRITQGICRH